MARISETGHAKNVANFEDLISACTGYGASYNPTRANIRIDNLLIIQTNARAALAAVNALIPAYSLAVGNREIAFEPLSQLVTRIVNAYGASGASKQSIDNVKTVARKLHGTRAKSKPKPQPVAEGEVMLDTPKTISVSQLSYDSRIENFDKLIQILIAERAYAPNEIELQVATLQDMLADFRIKNTAVINATTPLSLARINRNEILYISPESVYQLATDVKKYVKSVYNANSPQYKLISGLAFKKR